MKTIILATLLTTSNFPAIAEQEIAPAKALVYIPAEALAELNQLREEYHSNRDALKEINRTRQKTPLEEKHLPDQQKKVITQKRLKTWHQAFLNRNSSYEKYIFTLVRTYANLSTQSLELEKTQDELIQQHPKNCKTSLTESYRNQLSLLANASKRVLVNGIAERKAALLAKLLEPTGSIKWEDKMHFLGLPSEPQNWNIQAAYSLAQLRAGNISIARKENQKLLRKAEKLSKKGISLNYRKEGNVRTCQSLHREFLLHRAQIEAVSGEKKVAKEFLAKAQAIDEKEEIRKEQQSIIKELRSIFGA
jgi:hypothetical protein